MSQDDFQAALAPIVDHLRGLDPADPSARTTLQERFPIGGPELTALAALFESGVSDGWLCDRKGSETVSYSRVRKAGDGELSIDAVRMSGPGPGHTHPNGEFDLCFSVDGSPTFDGQPVGWVVYPPDSWHVPTVAGGTMNILYFLPGGAIEFGPKPS